MTAAGAILGDDGRLRFPRALVEDMVDKAAKILPALRPRPAPSPRPVGRPGALRHRRGRRECGRPVKNEYRPSTAQDLYDAARLAHHLDNIHFFQRTMVCCEIPDLVEMDLNTLYACLCRHHETCRHVLLRPAAVDPGMELIHMVAGGEATWRGAKCPSCRCPTASSCRR
jgi:trimethylamine--corrinoid protein Co-methyltransferase